MPSEAEPDSDIWIRTSFMQGLVSNAPKPHRIPFSALFPALFLVRCLNTCVEKIIACFEQFFSLCSILW